MNDTSRKNAQRLFVEIRFNSSNFNKEINLGRLRGNLSELIEMKADYEGENDCLEKEIMMYSISCLVDLLTDGQNQIVNDFADAVHTLPEVFMTPFISKRAYWIRYIRPFRRKYRKNYFLKFKKDFYGTSILFRR
jgi:hypothetical protein